MAFGRKRNLPLLAINQENLMIFLAIMATTATDDRVCRRINRKSKKIKILKKVKRKSNIVLNE